MMCPYCGVDGDESDYFGEENGFVTCLNCHEGIDLIELVDSLQDQITRIIAVCEEDF